MSEFDTVIRNAVVATASDVFRAEIGIAGGVIAALGALAGAGPAGDRCGRALRAPGRHRHPLSLRPAHARRRHPGQRLPVGPDLRRPRRHHHRGALRLPGPRDRACGLPWMTTIAARPGKPVIDYAFHLIASNPDRGRLLMELPALIEEGL